jgi:hypothetical protein
MKAEADALRTLLNHVLTCFKVVHWGASSEQPDFRDREEVGTSKADVVSSKHRGKARHAVVLDIDHPAWLVKSTTPGHYHLYIDVPGGIPHELYLALLGTLADCGVIEPGYARASQARGHSDVRLPWVKKPAPDQVTEVNA